MSYYIFFRLNFTLSSILYAHSCCIKHYNSKCGAVGCNRGRLQMGSHKSYMHIAMLYSGTIHRDSLKCCILTSLILGSIVQMTFSHCILILCQQ